LDPTTKQSLLQKDRRYVWHPFTQMKDYETEDHVLLERAEGVYLYDGDGNRYYDTVSSWWVCTHGHNHPRIRAAFERQWDQMDHVMFSGFTHQPGIELAEKLVKVTPSGLERVFYSDNGSTAVEVAIKMSFQYWQQIGQPNKTRFVFMENSYHGDTIGAVSVGGVELFHSMYKPLLFNTFRVPSPDVYRWPGENEEACVEHALSSIEAVFAEHADEIAGMIVEPMIQAAGGMIIYPPSYLRGVRELCDRYNVHLIADEVAVGFGRTGKMFACEHADISPDILCLSKALTAGTIPLAATLCTEEIYQAFYDDYTTMKTFFHGHSFTGNPLACAIAVESLRIFEDENVLEHINEVTPFFHEELERFRLFKNVGDVRKLGLIGVIELMKNKSSKEPFPSEQRIGTQVYKEGLKEGLVLRPLGSIIYFWLPLCVTKEQIKDILDRTEIVMRRLGLV
jgi:adenosylmethionine-8-amino-7-oxononanoate aminotransferase